MPKFLWRTDVHISDKTPGMRKDDWTQTVLGKLRQVYELGKIHQVHAILDGGDFFDIKSPAQNSHALIRAVAEQHHEYNIPVWANVGNHDCVYGDYSYLPQQPLGVLYATGVFNRLYDQYELVHEGVRIVGVPYHGVKYDLERFKKIQRGSEKCLIVVAHLLASPGGGTMFEAEDVIKYQDLSGVCPSADAFFFGHWHKDQGTIQLPSGQWVCNVGSLTRGSLNQDNFERTPKAVLIDYQDSTGLVLTEIPLQVTPSVEVFNVEKANRQDVRQAIIDTFADNLKSSLQSALSVDLEDVVRLLPEVDPQVRERALFYLQKHREG